MRKMIQSGFLVAAVFSLSFHGMANAAPNDGNNECPVGVLQGAPGNPEDTLNTEFGPGTSDLTQCIKKRSQVKVVMQINRYCRNNVANSDCPLTRAYALGNIRNMIKDYEVTHGMERGRDYEIVAIVHSGGGTMVLKNEGYNGAGAAVSGRNKFQSQVEGLLDMGVKFYFCQNTTRGYIRNGTLPASGVTAGGATAELIDGVEYTTAGVTAIADYISQGYSYVQP
jgi:intracellular sulfur oxidation DsrE/DsrF family protein